MATVRLDNNASVPVLTQSWLPAGAKVYQVALVDEPNTAGAKNFLSHFNPVSSGKVHAPLGFVMDSHCVAATNVNDSMTIFRTTAASGGTQYAANTITKFDLSAPDTTAEIRVSNPTVTTTGRVLIGIGPAIYPGGGGTQPSFVTPAGGAFPLIPAGTGIVFGTATGDTDQRWNIQYTWMEF